MTAISKDFFPNHIVLCGGIGGAKLALGLKSCLGSEQLMVVGNVGDDFEHWGFKISPDLDTLVYTLSGVSNQEFGWGRNGETWTVLEEVSRLGGDDWFVWVTAIWQCILNGLLAWTKAKHYLKLHKICVKLLVSTTVSYRQPMTESEPS